MSAGLNIAKGLRLDPDYLGGGGFALLAKKGAGKTYAMRVMAEEFWKAKVPFVALDPMDAFWGLRSSADGKGEGIPVAVFGGPHGDAPLERGAGKLMADLVVDEGLSMVLSTKHFGSRAGERQFAMEFLERLYRRNNELVHLLVDEADLFAPQRPKPGDQPLQAVMENIVRRGRNNGIGVTMATQRPAVLSKDVLNQVDGLIVMRLLGPRDRDSIDEWVGEHGDAGQGREVKHTLPNLETGEAWVWVPELGVLERTKIRATRTFDSSPTRKRGTKAREPKSFADVDMGAIEKKMASTIERAKAEDPKVLRRRIRELEKQLAERPTEKQVEEVEKVVEVPVLADGALDSLERAVGAIKEVGERVLTVGGEISGELRRVEASQGSPRVRGVGQGADRREPARPTGGGVPAPPSPSAVEKAGAKNPAQLAGTNGDDPELRITPAKQRILDALAALEAIGVHQASKTQLALFAQASPRSSGYTNNLGALRSAGLIDYPTPGVAALTEEGRAIAEGGVAPASPEELLAFVRKLVGPSRARIIDALVEVYPDALPKDELAERAGVSASSSGYTNNLGSLRSLGLIDYPEPGWAAATPVLFLEAVGR